MEQAAVAQLKDWENFYVIVGSSAGALTGLQFVVIALIAEARSASTMLEIRAFGTPTVVHFCAALLLSAILSAPWHTLSGAGFTLAACGVAGVVYLLNVIRHARRQTGYAPDTEDWFWYVALPLGAYAALAAAGLFLPWHAGWSLFVIAATSLALLFDGIHNSWDTVTYIAVEHGRRDKKNRTTG
ncbi:MAG TPA: hypothetical protein VGJ33_06290 [Candidatus Angelobacter sp.]|jgi:hypothetical protein